MQIDAILGILDDVGRAALDVVLTEIEAAKADGRLKLELDDGAGGDAGRHELMLAAAALASPARQLARWHPL